MSRVASGGLMNLPKASYNPETHRILKQLMDEAKLTNIQRAGISQALKNGQSLPVVWARSAQTSYVEENLFGTKKNYYFTKRTQNQIAESGAYDSPKYRGVHPIVNREQEKERLCNILTHGKDEQTRSNKTQGQYSKRTSHVTKDRTAELETEILDRLEFMNAMDVLGERKKYEQQMKQEIATKLRELEKLNKHMAKKYSHMFGLRKSLGKSQIDEVFLWE